MRQLLDTKCRTRLLRQLQAAARPSGALPQRHVSNAFSQRSNPATSLPACLCCSSAAHRHLLADPQVFPYCRCLQGSYNIAASPYTLSLYSTTPSGSTSRFCFQLHDSPRPASQSAVQAQCFNQLASNLDKISIKTSKQGLCLCHASPWHCQGPHPTACSCLRCIISACSCL